jgi:hypothetical protein
MFGFGNRNRNRNRVQNDTFGSKKLRNAAIAGVGMLAWQWWKNRQSNTQWSGGMNRSTSGNPESFGNSERSFSEETSSPAAGRY